MFFGHLPELFIVLLIGLIVFGPEKLPEIAGNVGKTVREVRQALDVTMNPEEAPVPDDFSTYYYDSLERSGEEPLEPDYMDGDVTTSADTLPPSQRFGAAIESPMSGDDVMHAGSVNSGAHPLNGHADYETEEEDWVPS